MPNYKINLQQNLIGHYVIMIYANSKKVGEIEVGTEKEEAKNRAKDIADAFKSTGIDDKTD